MVRFVVNYDATKKVVTDVLGILNDSNASTITIADKIPDDVLKEFSGGKKHTKQKRKKYRKKRKTQRRKNRINMIMLNIE